jgi:hypothetical protein
MSLSPLEDIEGLLAHFIKDVPPTIDIVPFLLEEIGILDDITPL